MIIPTCIVRLISNLVQPINTSPSKLLCENCGQIFQSIEDFEVHVEGCHEPPQLHQFESEGRFKLLSNESILEELNKYEQENIDLKCSKCGQIFHLRVDLENHIENEHMEEAIEKDISYLKNSLKILASEKPEDLEIERPISSTKDREGESCNQIFKTKVKLKKHKKNKHQNFKG